MALNKPDMTRKKILLHLDTDNRASVFDAITAIDARVDHLLSHHDVTPQNVTEIVHGAIFTRGPDDLKSTAIFVGGSDVGFGEQVFSQIQKDFFGPCRVSVMLDSNGSNTTAAAAVLSASKHVELSGARATVLAGTGPVGIRVAEILARAGSAKVKLTSRSKERAASVCNRIAKKTEVTDVLVPTVFDSPESIADVIGDSSVVFACGGAGALLWPKNHWPNANCQVAIDVNAVPPVGIEAINPTDKARSIDDTICYGAIGVGALKMKIHKLAIQRMFESNDQLLDVSEIYKIGQSLI